MQDRRLEIIYVNRIARDRIPKLISFPIDQTALDAAVSHPDRKTTGMMIATKELRPVARFVHWCAPKLTAQKPAIDSRVRVR